MLATISVASVGFTQCRVREVEDDWKGTDQNPAQSRPTYRWTFGPVKLLLSCRNEESVSPEKLFNTLFIIQISWIIVVNSSTRFKYHTGRDSFCCLNISSLNWRLCRFVWQGGPEAQIQRPVELFLHVIHRMCGRRLLLWCFLTVLNLVDGCPSISCLPTFQLVSHGAMVRSRHIPRTCHHSITGHTRTIDSHIHLSIRKMMGFFFLLREETGGVTVTTTGPPWPTVPLVNVGLT